MKHAHSAGIIIYYQGEDQPEYLLLQYAAGHWDFAKGHLEKGETSEQAALRELKEETGLTSSIMPGFQESFSYWLTDRDTGERVHKTVTFFVGQSTQKEVTVSCEHKGYIWLGYHAAIKQLTYANARQLLEKVNIFIEQQ